MQSERANQKARAIVVAKETDDYRIVTEDPNNWFVAANRPIAKSELVVPTGTIDHVNVDGVECVNIVLEETQEQKLIYTSVSAVPCDIGCAQTSLEIPWCLINHSCEPNIRDYWIKSNPTDIKHGETQAIRDIAEGEEFTYDYALEQYDYRSPFECSCGSDSCRGTIGGFKSLSSEQQRKMLSLATPFVQAKHRREAIPMRGDLDNDSPSRTGLVDGGKWFLEGSVPGKRNGNVSHGFRISEVLFNETTQFQDCLIFNNPIYGGVLVLDGIVQLSTSDEHIYHEMLVHPSMFTHPNPQRVVIIGGGDGGALREVLKHNPAEVVMIDIDEQVVQAAAEFLPSLNAGAFEDPRVTLLFEDASEALRRYESAFDVAVIDCNSAVGPSETLFENEFYSTVARSLNDGSVCAVQAGSMMEPEYLKQMRKRLENHFGRTTGFKLTLPVYHCGEYAFFETSGSMDPTGPDAATLSELQASRRVLTKYWSPAIHHASQVLPVSSDTW